MKTINLIAAIAVFSLVLLKPYAQTTSKEPVNSLKGGKWAVSFLIGTEVGANNSGSLNLTLKSHATKVFAVRLGVSTYLSSNEGSTSFEGRESPQSQDFTNASLFLNFLFYTNPSKPFSFFAGFGPVYRYSLQKSDNQYNSTYYTQSSSHTSQKEWALGGFGVMGAEWFPHPRFSITGEYNFSYTFGNSHTINTYISTSSGGPTNVDVYETDLDTKAFNFNIVKLGITAYF